MLLAALLTSITEGGTLPNRSARPALEQGPVHPTRLFVRPVEHADRAAVSALHRRLGARVVTELPQIGWQIVEVDADHLAQRRQEYALDELVSRADFDRARQLAYVPNDPLWPSQWSLQHIHADTAWNTTRGSSSVRVAVIDTGIERTHPDLAASLWINPLEIAGNGIDDDLNGLVDDVSGWDFVHNDSDPDDLFGHGTACAGIIAAQQDNSLGISGIAPACKIVGLKACNDSGYLFDSYVVPALLYAADEHCQVISMSFFGDQVTPAERAAIDYCWLHGSLPIAAAGNDAQCFPYYPGAYEHTLAVGSHSASDLRSYFSNWGSWVDVAAPGEGIGATVPGANYTLNFAGTSAATPHVAGVAALLFSAVPTATNARVRVAIEDSATPLNQPPIGAWANYGRIDALAALDRLLGTSSGSPAARLLFASPVGGEAPARRVSGSAAPSELVLYGVGLEAPNVVRVLRNGVALPIVSRSRNEVRARLDSGAAAMIALEVNGVLIDSFRWESGRGRLFAPSDANTRDPASTTGGFHELLRDDGVRLT